MGVATCGCGYRSEQLDTPAEKYFVNVNFVVSMSGKDAKNLKHACYKFEIGCSCGLNFQSIVQIKAHFMNTFMTHITGK